MLHFIYEEIHPVTEIPFYIGISTNPNQRHKQHLDTRDSNLRKKAIIDRLAVDDLEPRMNILESVNSFEQSRMQERYWIQRYASQGVMLTNIQDYDISGFIEVDDCLFRSLREAQWAVFFKTLDIPYQYREKGIIIEGYIPGFWLPKEDYFIEVGEDQDLKARELSLQTNKDTYIFNNSIALSGGDSGIRKEYPPSLWIHNLYAPELPSHTKVENLPQNVLVILQRLQDIGIGLCSSGHRISISPYTEGPFVSGYSFDDYFEIIQKQMKYLPSLIPTIKRLESELIAALHSPNGHPLFVEQEGSDGYLWSECARCGKIHMTHPQFKSHPCNDGSEGPLEYNSSRLIAAITMARQLRSGANIHTTKTR